MCQAGADFNHWVNRELANFDSSVGLSTTITALVNNPLPTIATIGLTLVGVPPPLASAMVTAAQGGSLEDIALSAGKAYISGKVGDYAGKSFAGSEYAKNLTPATTAAITQIVTSASGAAAGTALSGGSFQDVLKSGFTSAVGTYVSTSLMKEMGYTDPNKLDAKLVQGAISSATGAILAGKDIGKAITGSVTSTLLRTGIETGVNTLIKNSETLTGLQTSINEKKKDFDTFVNNIFTPEKAKVDTAYTTAKTAYEKLTPKISTYNTDYTAYQAAKAYADTLVSTKFAPDNRRWTQPYTVYVIPLEANLLAQQAGLKTAGEEFTTANTAYTNASSSFATVSNDYNTRITALNDLYDQANTLVDANTKLAGDIGTKTGEYQTAAAEETERLTAAAKVEADKFIADAKAAADKAAEAAKEAARIEAERVEAERVEAARVEAARVEAERVEAERVEAEKAEAERVEAARVEAEKVEAERVEVARVEAERVEAERVAADQVAETDRLARVAAQQVIDDQVAAALTDSNSTDPAEAAAIFKSVYGRDPTDGELADYAGQSEADVKALLGKQYLDLTNTSLANGIVTASLDIGTKTDAGPGSSPYRVDFSGLPIYADNPEAASLVLPTGYRVASVAEIEADNRPSGAYYDEGLNAWLTPAEDTVADYIGGTGSDSITGGTTDTDTTYVDDSASRLGDDIDTSKTTETIVAIDTDSQTALTDKGSVIDVADTAKVGDEVVSTDTDDSASRLSDDTITGGADTVTDTPNIDQLFDTDTITGGTDTVTDTPNIDQLFDTDTITGGTDDKDSTYVDDSADRLGDDKEEEDEEEAECPEGYVYNLTDNICEQVTTDAGGKKITLTKPVVTKPVVTKPVVTKPVVTTPPVTEPSFNWSSLLGLLSANQEQAPIKPELVGKAGWEDEEGPIDYTPFDYRDAIAEEKAKTDAEKARMVQEVTAAQGGSVDDLMAMLGIYDQDDSQSTGDPYLDELLATIR